MGTGAALTPILDWLSDDPGATGCVYCVDIWSDPTTAN
jgi:hypothetical protein